MVITANTKNNNMLLLTIDDDFSIRSTVTVESAIPSKKDELEPAPKSSTCYKRIRSAGVHFNESENKYFQNTKMFREEINELWYSRLDTREFRKVAGALGRAIASAERELEPSASSLSFKSVLQNTLDACRNCCVDTTDNEKSILTSQAQQALQQRLSESPDRLGLERLAVRQLGDDRHNRRRNLCKMLLGLQETLNQECFNNNSSNPDGNSHHAFSKAELVRARCQAISLPSRHFAREIAQAYAEDIETKSMLL